MSSSPAVTHKLACLEVWGGNREIIQPVELPGLAGWIYSSPLQAGSGGGDVHYLSVCERDALTRIAVADVSGHGHAVSALAEKLRDLMRKHINTWDQSSLMRELNQSFQEELRDVKFATVLVLGYYSGTGQLVFTNAGHLPPLWRHAAAGAWDFLEDNTPYAEADITGLPLGLISGTDYLQAAVRVDPGDTLLLYTDALPEARNPAGQELGPDGLLRLAHNLPLGSPEGAGRALLASVDAFRGGATPEDDQTLLILQRQPN